MNSYWPWWAGALGLALATINYTVTTDRSFGVSAAWERVLQWRAERRVERLNAQLADERVLAEALAAATAEQFGARPAATAAGRTAYGDVPAPDRDARPVVDARASVASRLPAPVVSQAALL
ncbi:transporter, partial [Planosporangium thailandense]